MDDLYVDKCLTFWHFLPHTMYTLHISCAKAKEENRHISSEITHQVHLPTGQRTRPCLSHYCFLYRWQCPHNNILQYGRANGIIIFWPFVYFHSGPYPALIFFRKNWNCGQCFKNLTNILVFFAIATCQTCNSKKVGQFSEMLSQMRTWNGHIKRERSESKMTLF